MRGETERNPELQKDALTLLVTDGGLSCNDRQHLWEELQGPVLACVCVRTDNMPSWLSFYLSLPNSLLALYPPPSSHHCLHNSPPLHIFIPLSPRPLPPPPNSFLALLPSTLPPPPSHLPLPSIPFFTPSTSCSATATRDGPTSSSTWQQMDTQHKLDHTHRAAAHSLTSTKSFPTSSLAVWLCSCSELRRFMQWVKRALRHICPSSPSLSRGRRNDGITSQTWENDSPPSSSCLTICTTSCPDVRAPSSTSFTCSSVPMPGRFSCTAAQNVCPHLGF